MEFFVVQWLVLIVGFVVHVLVDRSPLRRTAGRVVELALLWVVVGNGVFLLLGGLAHIGPGANTVAASIGYAPSMFQWEVGWADIAFGVLGIGCAWTVNRGGWLTAIVVGTSIALAGDGIGHIMQLVAHGNTAPNNVLALPSDFLTPALMVVLLALYRRGATAGARLAAATRDSANPAG
ncbi:MAG: DUF6790 family protein [Pseudonocardiaceae bacterium]